ncbi:Shikimate kinase [Candidatus Magnetomoraceae bacterium gMMP-15]
MTKNIYLTGFMGAGKTTVGQVLAKDLNYEFIDMDIELEKQFQMSIPKVFAELGEQTFRNSETDLLKRLSTRTCLIVATGGGVSEKTYNREIMRASGKIIHLKTELNSCMARLSAKDKESRPLWQDKESLTKLFNKRKRIYEDCDLSVLVDEKTPQQISNEIKEVIGGA